MSDSTKTKFLVSGEKQDSPKGTTLMGLRSWRLKWLKASVLLVIRFFLKPGLAWNLKSVL